MQPDSKTSASRRILIVEDDEFLIMDLELTLAATGYETVSAATTEEAFKRMEEYSLDGALLDVNLTGGGRSLSVADALVAASIPFAFMTGRSRSYLPERFQRARIIAKPYRLEDVLDALAEIIASPPIRPDPHAGRGPR